MWNNTGPQTLREKFFPFMASRNACKENSPFRHLGTKKNESFTNVNCQNTVAEPSKPPLTSLSDTTSTSSSLSSNQLHICQPRRINILPPDVREDNMCNDTICTMADGHNPSFSSSENYLHKCHASPLPKNTNFKSISVQTVVSVPVIEVVEQDTSWKEEMTVPAGVGRDINLKCHTDTPPVCPLYQSLIKLIEHTEKHMQDQRTKKDDITQDKVIESSNSVDLYVTHDVTDEDNFENIAAPLRETNSLPSQIHKRKQQIICEMKKKQEEREQRQKKSNRLKRAAKRIKRRFTSALRRLNCISSNQN